VDPQTPVEDSLGELAKLQGEGKIRLIGVSEVDVPMLQRMREVVEVVSVQNLFNLADQHHGAVLDYCEQEGLGFIPWYPLATGKLAAPGGPLDEIARDHDATPSQLALAWLLRRSSVMLPIPGTSSVAHLEENCGAATIQLTDEEYQRLTGLTAA
jgi:aryl-alcohol dehydrogenase-like predicted oxidoreductase